MKKALLLLVCCVLLSVGKAQYVTIPDTAFVSFLNYWFQFSPCMNGNQLDTTCPGIVNATTMDCRHFHINSMEGLQYFDNLESLICYGNNISGFPPFPAHLKFLVCDSNKITNLPTLPDSIATLSCNSNLLTQLPSFPNSLRDIGCTHNLLTTIPPLPFGSSFYCDYNQITNVPPFPDSLAQFSILGNPISCLPHFTAIGWLYFDSTNITCLPNYGRVIYSSPPLDSVPLCDSTNTNICPYCRAYFTIYPDSTNAGVYYGFNESTGNSISSYLWDFGDGTTSTQQYPDHAYAHGGQYYVCLTTISPDCTSTYCDSFFLRFKTDGGLMSQLHIIGPTDVESIENSNFAFSLSPNPATSSIIITIDETMIGSTLTITDITGRKMTCIKLPTAPASGETVLPTDYTNGIYFVTISNGEERATKKLIIQK